MIETKLEEYLGTFAALTALVGDRIYLEQPPQTDTRPYICFRVTETQHYKHMTGQSQMAVATLELQIAGNSYNEARGVLEVLRKNLDAKIYNVNAGATNPVNIRYIHLQGFNSATLQPMDGSDQGKRGITSEWDICYTEPPT